MTQLLSSTMHVPTRARFQAAAPKGALTLSMCVAFGVLAALVGHVSKVAAIDVHQYELCVALACLAGLPTTYVAVRAQANTLTGTSVAKPFLVTLLTGTLLGTLGQAYTALRLAAWERLWFCDIPLGTNRVAWIALGAVIGALASVVAFVVLVVGLRAMRQTPSVLDADERLGVPSLAMATLAAAVLLAVLIPEELVPGAVVAGLGTGGLVVMLLRDRERHAFVTRVFDGTEPGVEILWQPTETEKGDLCPVVDVPYGEVVLAEANDVSTYRTTARGRGLMLLAETREETLAPLEARQKVATRAAVVAVALVLLRLVALMLVPR